MSVQGTIHNNDIVILLETGCNISYLNDKYGQLIKHIDNGNVCLTSANATPMDVTRRAILAFNIQDVACVKRVYLIKNLTYDFLIGNDFLLANKGHNRF